MIILIGDSVGYGGGVAVEGGGPVTIAGNTIIGNMGATLSSASPIYDKGHGGGVYVESAVATLTGNTIQNNKPT